MKDSFSFVDGIVKQDSTSCHLCSFDVSSLFTCIPLDETINIAINYVFENVSTVNGLSRDQFKKLLEMVTKETNFLFNRKCYDQVDGVAMGSPLAPILANIFMRHFEENALRHYNGTQPILYRRYVDDSFIVFKLKTHVQPFFQYLNGLHANIKFTKDEESENSLSFLDIKIMKREGKFVTSTFYKPTHTGVYMNWYSFAPRKYKINLVKCLLNRAWKICSDEILFDADWEVIKSNLLKNQYPEGLLNAINKNFKEKMKSSHNDEISYDVPKKEIKLILPFYGKQSDILQKRLLSLFSNCYPQVSL